jgi:hypothetical protein
MNAKTLAELVLKVWGVLLILGTLVSLPAALWMVWTVPLGDRDGADGADLTLACRGSSRNVRSTAGLPR